MWAGSAAERAPACREDGVQRKRSDAESWKKRGVSKKIAAPNTERMRRAYPRDPQVHRRSHTKFLGNTAQLGVCSARGRTVTWARCVSDQRESQSASEGLTGAKGRTEKRPFAFFCGLKSAATGGLLASGQVSFDVRAGSVSTEHPVTMAVRVLRQHAVPFVPHLYAWEPRGGTSASARALGVDEHAVIKTLVFEDEKKTPLCILMHGDREVSAKNLARAIGVKSVAPCRPDVADRHSGYQVGGTSPFGLKRAMPIYAERSVLELPKLYVNGGARGFLVEITGADLARVLSPRAVDVAIR